MTDALPVPPDLRPAARFAPPSPRPPLDHLDGLEGEAIHVLREVAGQCANPVPSLAGP
jgi:hypothetical protein